MKKGNQRTHKTRDSVRRARHELDERSTVWLLNEWRDGKADPANVPCFIDPLLPGVAQIIENRSATTCQLP